MMSLKLITALAGGSPLALSLVIVAGLTLFWIDLQLPLGWAVWFFYIPLSISTFLYCGSRAGWTITVLFTVLLAIAFFFKPLAVPLEMAISYRTTGVSCLWVIALITWSYLRMQTKARRHQAALGESENRFQQLADSINDVFWLIDADTKQGLYLSPAYEKIWGRPLREVQTDPQSWIDAIHPDDRHKLDMSQYINIPTDGMSTEYRIIRPDGTVRWIRDRSFLVKNTTGALRCIAGVATDITDYKNAEEQLRTSEMQLRGILENAAEGIIVSDENGIILSFNPSAERIFEYTAAEAIGQNVSILMPSPYREQHDSYIAHYLNTGQKKIIGIGREVLGRRKDGTIFPIDLALSEFQVSDKPHFSGIVRDISERKRVEQQLRENTSKLRELSAHMERVREDERTGIAREIHDELGSIFTVLKMNIEHMITLSGDHSIDLTAKLHHTAELLSNAIQTSRRIINALRPSALDLGLWAAIEWQAAEFTKHVKIPCEVVIEEALHDCEPLDERATMMFRIVQESLTNIARHAEATKARIHCRQVKSHLLIEISDNGKGVSNIDLKKDNHWGIVGMQERARVWKGELKIKGMPGQGTTVSLYIPIEEQD